MKASELIRILQTEMAILGTDPDITIDRVILQRMSTETKDRMDFIHLHKDEV